MNDDQINDLKQFITTTVSQQLADTENRLIKRINNLESKMVDGFAGVSDAIEAINDHQTEQDTRMTKLESAQA